MLTWDENNIHWMEDAAAHTNYYEKLLEYIAPYLKVGDQVCEIACGLGHLTCAIANKVDYVTAIDISPEVIAKTREKAMRDNITNLSTVECDWLLYKQENHSENAKFDVVLLSYFSALKKNWKEISSLSNRLIIAVLANGESGTKLKSKLYKPIFEDVDKNGRETIYNVVPFLEENNIPYELIECEIEYGQPLQSIEDAYKYVARYYSAGEAETKQFLQKRLVSTDKGYYLPKMKKSGILIIKVGEGEERRDA